MLTKKDWVMLCSIAYAVKSCDKNCSMEDFLTHVASGFEKIVKQDCQVQLNDILSGTSWELVK